MAVAIGMGVMAAGSLFSGLMGGSASQKAAEEYQKALEQSEQYLEGQLSQGEQNYSPFLTAGQGAVTQLSSLLGTPGQGLLTPWSQTFTAPTAAQAEQTPGYQFQLKAGEDAMQNSAAGQGSLLSGRTLANLNSFAQGTASTNYQNTFNNALTQYQSAYNAFLNNQQNTYNMLSGLSNQGLNAAQGEGSLISGMGGDIASLMAQKGAAKAQGTIGAANAYGGILSNIGGDISGMGMLSMLNGGFGGGNTYESPTMNQSNLYSGE